MKCRLCESQEEESQSHQLVCRAMVEECEELRHNISVKYEDFFGDIDSQISATKLYSKVMSARKKMFQQLDQ